MRLIAFLTAGCAFMIVAVAQSESLLMSYEEYMARCMDTYGQDRTTKSVCEAQFQAIEKKEQALMAQAEAPDDADRLPSSLDDRPPQTD
ncbi:hypothetical protein [Photobacterium sp. TY1-4]|uniref:hypothetical protein n=1 Tax=Photobacterium sp. TY1-4 TaxID=2899122 RepID=UPI0021BE244B|nr:hypothetical protein [Photobacterium sp. TY1-4]UXI04228.1 hypothetical protein NH461_19200 [Photobacterium sp. TY1-4]